MTKNGDAINVQTVARTAQVHPDTVRRSGDLYVEIKRLRDASLPRGPVRTSAPTVNAAAHTALKARLLAAQAEVADLRKEVAEARRAAHQALGTAGTVMDQATADQLRQDNAALTVMVTDLQRQVEALQADRESITEELDAAHEVNRGFVRTLTATQAELQQREAELVRLRRTKH
jgi:chromosome segregation ATPase